MEKLNITEILKDCPKDMELYSPIFGDVYLDEIRPYLAVVVRISDKQKEEFLYDGRFDINGECMLFPSKENRDWNTFQRPFKEGDVAVTEKGHIHLLRTKDSSYCAYREEWKGLPPFDSTITTGVKVVRFASKEEKEKFFKVINENGYKWNSETKTLEKLPMFKVGDRIKHRLTGDVYKVLFVLSDGCGGGVYDVAITNEIGKSINIKEQDNYELIPNKFDITTLKAFDKILVRDRTGGRWHQSFFGYHIEGDHWPGNFITFDDKQWVQCIPYKGNEHLVNTSNDCSSFYKTWE